MPLKLILVKFDFDWGNILILTDFEHLILDLFWSKIKGFGQKYRVTALDYGVYFTDKGFSSPETKWIMPHPCTIQPSQFRKMGWLQ